MVVSPYAISSGFVTPRGSSTRPMGLIGPISPIQQQRPQTRHKTDTPIRPPPLLAPTLTTAY
jgi:hypothetical protein